MKKTNFYRHVIFIHKTLPFLNGVSPLHRQRSIRHEYATKTVEIREELTRLKKKCIQVKIRLTVNILDEEIKHHNHYLYH